MKRFVLDEQEAFRRLKRIASVRNHTLTEVAREVLAADEVFQRMEDERAPRHRTEDRHAVGMRNGLTLANGF